MKPIYIFNPQTNVVLASINVPHAGESVTFRMTDDQGDVHLVEGEFCVDYIPAEEHDSSDPNWLLVEVIGDQVRRVDVCLFDAPCVTLEVLAACCELVREHSGY